VNAYSALHPAADADADRIADPCDCAPGDGGAFDVPDPVASIDFAPDRTTIAWPPLAERAGAGTVYDVLRGDLAELRSTGSLSDAVCVAAGIPAASTVDSETPGPFGAFYYLIQARNACGATGWGTNSDGTPRVHLACP